MRLSLLVLAALLLVPSATAARRDCVDLPFELGCPPQEFPPIPRVPGLPGDPNLPGPPILPPVPPLGPPGGPGIPPGLPPIPELPDTFGQACAMIPPVPASTRPVSDRLEAMGHEHLADDVEAVGDFARDPGERCAHMIG